MIDLSTKEELILTKIGTMTDDMNYLMKADKGIIDFNNYDIHARNYGDVKEYLGAISNFLARNKK